MRKLVQEQKELQMLESRIREANAGMATSSSSAAISIEKLRKQLTPYSKSFICCILMNIARTFTEMYEYYDYSTTYTLYLPLEITNHRIIHMKVVYSDYLCHHFSLSHYYCSHTFPTAIFVFVW